MEAAGRRPLGGAPSPGTCWDSGFICPLWVLSWRDRLTQLLSPGTQGHTAVWEGRGIRPYDPGEGSGLCPPPFLISSSPAGSLSEIRPLYPLEPQSAQGTPASHQPSSPCFLS